MAFRIIPFRVVHTFLLAATLTVSPLLSHKVFSQDETLTRSLLIKLARNQSNVLCSSEIFTQCMGFTEAQCIDLSEKSIEQCLLPLPEQIDLDILENQTIENCPKKVYQDAGFDDEKAQQCLAEALE